LPFFEEQNESLLFNDGLSVFQEANFVMGNMEFVLTDNPKSILKAGPILWGNTSYINVFKKAGFHLLSLANNHIKDCGSLGVQSTIETCEKAGIATLGAGKNLQEAKKTYIKIINGWKIGFCAFAEQEFNVATDSEYGANYLDLYEDFDAIQSLKKKVDFVVVIYHGGIEYYEYPSPLLQKKCRKFIDKGADLVTCQHSHCIGTIENYQSKNIIYGQGNTLFGYRKDDESWNLGLLLKLILSEENIGLEVSYIPVKATSSGIKLMNNRDASSLLTKITEKSKLTEDSNFIKKSWEAFCNGKKESYLPYLLAFNRFFIHFNRITKNRFVSFFFRKKYIRTSSNIIRCEAHNEVIQTILNNYLK
jgi:poly-gamma-glutamate synthesis protein (capsule biosynthesis protein)